MRNSSEVIEWLDSRTGRHWTVISKAEALHSLRTRYVEPLYYTYDAHGHHGDYFYCYELQPKPIHYDNLLNALHEAGLKMMPVVKYELDKFPKKQFHEVYVQAGMQIFIEGEIGFTGDISVKQTGSAGAITYTLDKALTFKSAAAVKINRYFSESLQVISISIEDNSLNLKVESALSTEFIDMQVSLSGNKFSASVSPKPIRLEYMGLQISGSVGLQITGSIYEGGNNNASISQVPAVNGHSWYYYVGFGVIIVGGVAVCAFTAGGGCATVLGIAGSTGAVAAT